MLFLGNRLTGREAEEAQAVEGPVQPGCDRGSVPVEGPGQLLRPQAPDHDPKYDIPPAPHSLHHKWNVAQEVERVGWEPDSVSSIPGSS